MSIAGVRDLCVGPFPLSKNRAQIMAGFERLLAKLAKEGIKAEIWIDGSFISKKLNPSDIDILVCADAETYDANSSVRHVLDWLGKEDLKPKYFCDSYLQLDYPEGHKNRELSERTKLSWRRWFHTDRSGNSRGLAAILI